MPPPQNLEGGVLVPGRESPKVPPFSSMYVRKGRSRRPSATFTKTSQEFCLCPRVEQSLGILLDVPQGRGGGREWLCSGWVRRSQVAPAQRGRPPTWRARARSHVASAARPKPALHPRPALWLAKGGGASSEPAATRPKWSGAGQSVAARRAATRATGPVRGPHASSEATAQRLGRAAPRGPWLAAGTVTLHPMSGSAHLSARGASTFSFLGLGSSSAAAIFTLPPHLSSSARRCDNFQGLNMYYFTISHCFLPLLLDTVIS